MGGRNAVVCMEVNACTGVCDDENVNMMGKGGRAGGMRKGKYITHSSLHFKNGRGIYFFLSNPRPRVEGFVSVTFWFFFLFAEGRRRTKLWI
jgi:hypothetical protein